MNKSESIQATARSKAVLNLGELLHEFQSHLPEADLTNAMKVPYA